jgi:hypothetical protein
LVAKVRQDVKSTKFFNEVLSIFSMSQDYNGQYLICAVVCFVDGSSAGSGNDIDTVLIAVVRMMRDNCVAQRSLLEPSKDEYVTRHLIDGRIIYSDHRCVSVK